MTLVEKASVLSPNLSKLLALSLLFLIHLSEDQLYKLEVMNLQRCVKIPSCYYNLKQVNSNNFIRYSLISESNGFPHFVKCPLGRGASFFYVFLTIK